MDKFRRVIHKPHGFSLGKSSSVATGNESDPQAVEAGRNSTLPEEMVNPPVFVSGQLASDSSAIKEFCKDWRERRIDWHREILAWIVLVSFGIAQANGSIVQVNVTQQDLALAKPAASVKSDSETNLHPFRLSFESILEPVDFVVRKFGLVPLPNSADSERGKWVRLNQAAPFGFTEELGKEFEFKPGSVVADTSIMYAGSPTPAHVNAPMLVSELMRVNDAFTFQERFNGLPRHPVTPHGIAFTDPMSCQIVWYPGNESCAGTNVRELLFYDRSFLGHAFSFTNMGGIVVTQAGRVFYPVVPGTVAFTDIQEGRPLVLAKVGHEKQLPAVPHLKRQKLTAPVANYGGLTAFACVRFLPLHHEARFPLGKTALVSRVSHLGLVHNLSGEVA